MYLASVAGLFGEVWVLIPLVILVVLLGVTGAFLVPGEQRLADLADRGEVAAHDTLDQRLRRVVLACAGLVLVAVFLMVVKPGG